MVMKGTTPRSLSWTSALGALALAGILLPASPIWAQKDDAIEFEGAVKDVANEFNAKPDESVIVGLTQEPAETVRIVVRDDEGRKDDAIEFEGDVTVSKAKPNETVIVGEARRPVDPARIIIRANEGRKEAIQKAVEQLNAQIKALAEKENATEAERLQEETLKRLVDQLEAMEKSNSSPEGVTFQARSITIDGKPKGDPKEIEEARKRVEELQKEANDLYRQHQKKQVEVFQATRKLIDLQGNAPRFPMRAQLNPATINPRPQGSAETVDQQRLDQLDNKLSKVLEELESLKKRKSEGGDKE